MKQQFLWFKHPKDLSNDKRMSALIDKEGGRGYGTYMYILEMLYMQIDGKLSFQQLKTMERKGFGKVYMEKIIRNYKLFRINGEEFESAISYSDTAQNEVKPAAAPPANNQPTDNELPTNLETTTKHKVNKNTDKPLENSKKNKKLILARVREEKRREREEEEKKKKETADAANSSSRASTENGDADGRPTATSGCTLNVCDDSGRPQAPLRPIRPWQELVDGIPESQSAWLDIAYMKSGYGVLLKKYIKAATEFFKEHILTYDKGDALLTMSDVHSYFINFIRAGSRTSMMLRDALHTLDAGQSAENGLPPDPYRYEQRSGNGQRTYLGCPIPADAPPRPNDTAFWNMQEHRWVSQEPLAQRAAKR